MAEGGIVFAEIARTVAPPRSGRRAESRKTSAEPCQSPVFRNAIISLKSSESMSTLGWCHGPLRLTVN
jgi:hypothetical protein